MGYITDFTNFLSGIESPHEYILWSALVLEGFLCGTKIAVLHGDYFPYSPQLYAALVGTAGSGKSTPMKFVRTIMRKHFPLYLLSEELQSREAIISLMSSVEGTRTWKPEGAATFTEFHPFFCIVDELALFTSTGDRGAMINFLIGAHGNDYIGTAFKKDIEKGKMTTIINPHVCLLGCAVPDWVMRNLQTDLLAGGLGRRMIIVYAKRTKSIPFPRKPDTSSIVYERIIEHLKAIESLQGYLTISPLGQKWWIENYDIIRAPDSALLIGQFHETRQVEVLKVATLLALDERPFKLVITDEHLACALDFFNRLEPGMRALTAGIGDNSAAPIAARVYERVVMLGGEVQERRIRADFWNDCKDERRYKEAIDQLLKTEKLVAVYIPKPPHPQAKLMLLTPEHWSKREQQMKQGV